jgi:predicted DNA-binding transcriptional regulator YafY
MSMMTKPAWERIYLIDKEIASGKFPNTEYLARRCREEYGLETCSTSTISRDTDFMRERQFAPIAYNAKKRGYYYEEKTFRIPGSFATAEDMQAICIVKNLLAMYNGSPVYEAAKQLLDTITAPLADKKNPNWFENRIVAPQPAVSVVQNDVWDAITRSLKENRVIEFDYRGANDDEYKRRRVRPYQLLFDSGAWLVYGYAEERRAIRIFLLSRMKNVSPAADTFLLPCDFDFRANTGGSHFGVFVGQKKYHFRITFYDEAARFVRERVWADDQRVKENDDGVVISFTSSQFEKVLEWVLSQGCSAKPLAPQVLVDAWKEQIRQMQKCAECAEGDADNEFCDN